MFRSHQRPVLQVLIRQLRSKLSQYRKRFVASVLRSKLQGVLNARDSGG
jgi:hypothetical protein